MKAFAMSGGDKYWEGRIMEDQGPVILAAKRARNGRSGKWSASPTLALGCARYAVQHVRARRGLVRQSC